MSSPELNYICSKKIQRQWFYSCRLETFVKEVKVITRVIWWPAQARHLKEIRRQSCFKSCEELATRHPNQIQKRKWNGWPKWQRWGPDVTECELLLVSTVAKYVRRRRRGPAGAQISDRRVLGGSLGPAQKKVWKYLRHFDQSTLLLDSHSLDLNSIHFQFRSTWLEGGY